jgi:hypothetical protein
MFREINKHKSSVHHDALEFPDGKIVLLTHLREGQHATVLQLPVLPRVTTDDAQRHVSLVELEAFLPGIDIARS